MLARIKNKFSRVLRTLSSPKEVNDSSTGFNVRNIDVQEIKQFLAAHPLKLFKGAKSNTPLVVDTDNKARFIRFSLQTTVSFHLDTIEIYNKNGVNVAKNKRTIISSMYNDDPKYNGEGALKGRKNGGNGFHTKREANPWLIVDLGSIRNLDKVIVYNTEGQFYTRALSLKIETSRDLVNWSEIYDNWSAIKGCGQSSVAEQGLLFAGILEASKAQAVIKELKKTDRYDDALYYHDLVNQLVKDKGVALGPHGFTQTFDLRSDSKKQKVYSELSWLLKVLNEDFGVAAFISSGTLLGIVRDGAFIGHDDDVDICYISNAYSEQGVLEERESLVAFLVELGCRVSPSGIAHYWCTTPNGLNLDIFTGFIEQGYCSMNPIGRRKLTTDKVLPLDKSHYQGVELYLPNDPNSLLLLNYGESWRTPDPLWTFNWGQAKSDFKFLYF
ncbi:discoidin domain-containing protein [Shewanella maritima]|uniref:discoidin domain-containing protein n=1 Tax=Shewanella maritima TaxID=2520507 RepID=UPI0037352FA7